jgi:ArsR family transcriptional regulator, arsenate/arsenite/antimonite-responsive transcriptional repressor
MATKRAVKVDPEVPCCEPVRSTAFDEDDAAELARSFAALADPVRLRLYSLIASANDEVCNCDLIEPVGRSQPTVSHHLKVLREAGLVAADKRGIWVWYRAVPERLEQLRNALG